MLRFVSSSLNEYCIVLYCTFTSENILMELKAVKHARSRGIQLRALQSYCIGLNLGSWDSIKQ